MQAPVRRSASFVRRLPISYQTQVEGFPSLLVVPGPFWVSRLSAASHNTQWAGKRAFRLPQRGASACQSLLLALARLVRTVVGSRNRTSGRSGRSKWEIAVVSKFHEKAFVEA